MAQTVTLASAGTAQIILNPVAKSTTVGMTLNTTGSTGAITVEFSLDDPSLTPSPTMRWFTLSSVAAMLSSNLTPSLSWTILTPIGAVRLNSTALGSSVQSYTLTALQSVTA